MMTNTPWKHFWPSGTGESGEGDRFLRVSNVPMDPGSKPHLLRNWLRIVVETLLEAWMLRLSGLNPNCLSKFLAELTFVNNAPAVLIEALSDSVDLWFSQSSTHLSFDLH